MPKFLDDIIISSGGHIVPSADSTVDIGNTSSLDFRTLYIREIDIHNQRFRLDYSGTIARLQDHSSVGDGFQFLHLGTEILRLGNGTSTTATFAGDVRLPASGKLYLWTGHNANYLMYDEWVASASSGMTIQNSAATGEIYLKSGNALTLTLDDSQNATFAGDVNVGGFTDSGTSALNLRAGGEHDTKLGLFESSENYGFSLNYDGGDNRLYIKRHDNSAGGTAVLSFQRYDDIAHFAGNVNFSSNKGLTWAGSHSVRVESNILKMAASSGIQLQNNTTVIGNLTIPEYIYHTSDSNTLIGFPGNDRVILHAGGNSNLELVSNGVAIRYNGGTKLQTVSAGVDISGNLTTSATATFNSSHTSIITTGSGTSHTQGAIQLRSGTTDTPSARGQGVFMFNEGKDTTWYMGTRYQNADEWQVGRATGTSVNTEGAQDANAFLQIDNAGNATFAGGLTVAGNTVKGYATGTRTINSTSYTMIGTVDGDRLASVIELTLTGTSNNVVIGASFEITVMHSQDIFVKSMNGDYKDIKIKITSNNNEDFSIEAMHTATATDTPLEVCIFPKAGETCVVTGTDPGYSGLEHEHTAFEGTCFSANDNSNTGHRVLVNGELEASALDINGNADISGTLDVAGVATLANVGYLGDGLGSVQYTLKSANNGTGTIDFGDVADVNIGRLQYNHVNDSFLIRTNNATALTLDSSQKATFAGDLTVTGTDIRTGSSNGLDLGDDSSILTIGRTNEIWTQQDVDADATLYLNYRGYNAASSRFRSFDIRDGKAGQIALFNGTDKSTTFGGGLTIPDYINHASDSGTKFGFSANDTFVVRTGGAVRLTVNDTAATFAGELEATSLDINGNADISGTLTGGRVFAKSYYQGATTVGFLIETSIVTNNYAMIHGTIKLEQFNNSTFQTIEFSATLLNNGSITTKAGVANIAITIKLFNYNSVWYIWVPQTTTYTTCTAYVSTANSYQGQIESFNEVVSVQGGAVPSSGVTNSTDLVALVKATTAYVDAKTWNGNDITSGVVASAYLDSDTMHLGVNQTVTNHKKFSDDKYITFGDGNDMRIFHDTSGAGPVNRINSAIALKIADQQSASVTIGKEDSSSGAGDATDVVIANKLTVNGDFVAKGEMIIETTTNLAIKDSVITVNDGSTGTPSEGDDIGIMFERGNAGNVFMGWDESIDKFIFVQTDTDAQAATGLPTNGLVYSTEGANMLTLLAGSFQAISEMTIAGNNVLHTASGTNTFPTLNQNTTGSSGSCTGNALTASSATIASKVTINSGFSGTYPMLVEVESSGIIYNNTNVTFNGTSNTLTSPIFAGNLTGNVTGNVTGNTSGSSGSCTGNAASVTNGVYTTGDQSIAGKKTFTGPTTLEQTLFYDKSAGSLDTTGFACAGLSSGGNGASATFVFECGGGAGNSYQRIVYNCWSVQGTWNTSKSVDEGGNKFDVTASANGSTITFTFKSRSGTQYYTPRVHVQAMGQSIVTTY